MSGMTLVEFLMARICEEEERAVRQQRYAEQTLAECEAKRRLIESVRANAEREDPRAWNVETGVLLRALASQYPDHPDWAVTKRG